MVMAACAKGGYRPRRPRETAFYRLVEEHCERFEQVYPERYEDRYGYFRSVIRETVYKYLDCGDLLVVCVHSFGNLLNFHPHLHVMAADGGFTTDGAFHPLPTMSLAPIEELSRHRVLGMLRRKGLLPPERIKLIRSWAHSGFNVNASVRIVADDATGREKLTLGPVPQGAYWRFWLSGLFRTNCGRSILDFG